MYKLLIQTLQLQFLQYQNQSLLYNQTNLPFQKDSIKQININDGGIAIITNDNSLYVHGNNTNKQLSNGTEYIEEWEQITDFNNNVKFFEFDGTHSILITLDNQIYFSGKEQQSDMAGVIGNENISTFKKLEIEIPFNIGDIIAPVIQENCTILFTNKTIYAVGNNTVETFGDQQIQQTDQFVSIEPIEEQEYIINQVIYSSENIILTIQINGSETRYYIIGGNYNLQICGNLQPNGQYIEMNINNKEQLQNIIISPKNSIYIYQNQSMQYCGTDYQSGTGRFTQYQTTIDIQRPIQTINAGFSGILMTDNDNIVFQYGETQFTKLSDQYNDCYVQGCRYNDFNQIIYINQDNLDNYYLLVDETIEQKQEQIYDNQTITNYTTQFQIQNEQNQSYYLDEINNNILKFKSYQQKIYYLTISGLMFEKQYEIDEQTEIVTQLHFQEKVIDFDQYQDSLIFLTENHKVYVLGDNSENQLGLFGCKYCNLSWLNISSVLQENESIQQVQIVQNITYLITDQNNVYIAGRRNNVQYLNQLIKTSERYFQRADLSQFNNITQFLPQLDYIYLENGEQTYGIGTQNSVFSKTIQQLSQYSWIQLIQLQGNKIEQQFVTQNQGMFSISNLTTLFSDINQNLQIQFDNISVRQLLIGNNTFYVLLQNGTLMNINIENQSLQYVQDNITQIRYDQENNQFIKLYTDNFEQYFNDQETENNNQQDQPNGMSTGAIVGIIIACVVVIIVIILVVIFLYKRQKNKETQQPQDQISMRQNLYI